MGIINPKLKMAIASHYIPKDNPARPAGEDAHFFSEKAMVIGIADGVGGWSEHGIDAGEYARELMENAAVASTSASASADGGVTPKNVLEEAFYKTTSQGSSTACIISVAGNRLRAANLGDSGFIVIRQGKTVYKSPVQQYRFNFPYQLGAASGNVSEEAEELAVELRRGDVVVAGTDGLFDNMFAADIERAVNYCLGKERTAGVVARVVALLAHRSSLDRKKDTPFSVAAREAGLRYFGGKYDDITVVVAYVSDFVNLNSSGFLR